MTKSYCEKLLVWSLFVVSLVNTAFAQVPYICETNGGVITITRYTGSGDDVTIPDTISGLPVTEIGSNAFLNCGNLINVTIGDGVTNIDQLAFASCTNLMGIYFFGDAPNVDSDVFLGDAKATVYYVSGSLGFGPTFGGLPTALYNPDSLSVTPLTLNFGSLDLGRSLTKNLVVRNTGTVTLYGAASVLDPFSIVSGDSYILDPGESQIVAVCYSPVTAGATDTADVTLTGGTGLTVRVSGSASAITQIPTWATGTFNGYVYDVNGGCGLATMTVTAKGLVSKVTGKISAWGTNYTFTTSYTNVNDPVGGYPFSATAKAGSTSFGLALTVQYQEITGNPSGTIAANPNGNLGCANGAFGDYSIMMYRNVGVSNYAGYYTATLASDGAFGSGYLALTVDAKGNVKTTGKLGDGTALSLSSALLFDGSADPFVVLYSAPAIYKGGYFFGGATITGSGTTNNVLSPRDGMAFLWMSFNPLATSDSGGFNQAPDIEGGYYSKLISLQSFYTVGSVSLPSLSAKVKTTDLDENNKKVTTSEVVPQDAVAGASPAGLVLTTTANGFSVPKATIIKKDTSTGLYNYDGAANAAGLTISFAKATGLFKGSFGIWYDYDSALDNTPDSKHPTTSAHTQKKVSYEGALTPVRANPTDGVDGRGFFLWPVKVTPDAPAKPYTYKSSYDFVIQSGT